MLATLIYGASPPVKAAERRTNVLMAKLTDARHAGNRGQEIQKLLIMRQIPHHGMNEIIGTAARLVTAHHFRNGGDVVFEGRQCFLDLPLERDGNEDTHIAEQAVLIEHGGITANDAFLFQLADTAQRRREGKADPGRQIAPGSPARHRRAHAESSGRNCRAQSWIICSMI